MIHQPVECPRCQVLDVTLLSTWRDRWGIAWWVMKCGDCLVVWLQPPDG